MKHQLNCELLIDINEPSYYLSNLLFEERGCKKQIEVTASDQQAIDFPGQKRQAVGEGLYPDLIFLDIHM